VAIRAVLFDFGGVIADSPFDTFARYERQNGLPEDFVRSLNAANPHDNAWARLERAEIDFDTFCDKFAEEAAAAGGRVDARELFAMLSHGVRPDMVRAVERCHEGFATALLTNNFVTPMAESTHAHLLGLFDVVVESAVVGIRKPDPAFYLLACDKLGISPREAVFLDDLGVNLKPARELGMTTIKVRDTDEALAELEEILGIALRSTAL
jgi:putative hydrolase of the HAD superfamily